MFTRQQKNQLKVRAEDIIRTIESQTSRPLQANPSLRKMQPITEVLQVLGSYRRRLDANPGARELLTINSELADLLYRVNNARQRSARSVGTRRHAPHPSSNHF
jgi:hypothetical protein